MKRTLKEVSELVGEKYHEIKSVRDKITSFNEDVESKGETPTDEQIAKRKELRDQLDKLNDEYIALKDERTSLERDARIDDDQKRGEEIRFVYMDKKSLGDDEKNISKNFQIGKVIRAMASGEEVKDFEAEIIKDGVSERDTMSKTSKKPGSIYIPYRAISSVGSEKRDHTVGTTTSGGHTVDTMTMPLIDVLRNRMVMFQTGATYLPNLQADLKWPRKTSGTSATWEGENDAAAESTMVFDTVSLSPNRLAVYSDVSDQLLVQSNEAFETVVREDLTTGLMQTLQNAFINGSGSNTPTGVLNLSGINTVSIGTDGGALTWAKAVDLATQVDIDNALEGTLNYVTNAAVVGHSKTTEKSSSTAQYIMGENGRINGYNVLNTNAVPSNLTKGSGTNLSAMIFGAWQHFIIGQFGGLDLIVDPYTQKLNGLTRIVVNSFWDFASRHDDAFAKIVDIDTSA